MSEKNSRERLESRLGFILISAGCAIGIGNVWKFPYLAGQNGGGIFVLIYLFFLAILGIPVMTMEFSMGRASRKSPVHLYQKIEPKGSKWHLHGFVCMAGNYLLMMFYTTVAGWMLKYFVDMAKGSFEGMDKDGVAGLFSGMLASPSTQVGYMAAIVIVGFLINSIGLQKGLEKVSKWMMSSLLIIMAALAVNSILMKGSAEGLGFYLLPDINKVNEIGWSKVIVSAMNQAFFTLSIGIGSMAIFGSYIGNQRSLMGESVQVGLLDTFVAIVSGLIIFPACFTYGVQPDSGPSLIFITLPHIFNNMPLGRVWGSLFFVFMSFAAFSTVLAVFETILACTMDLTGWSRKKASFINCFAVLILSLPCALGFNLLSFIEPMGKGTSFLDLEDFLVSNLILPIGSFIFVIFCISRKGWGWNNFVAEANKGKGINVKPWMRVYMTYILPVLVMAFILLGLFYKG